MAGLDGWQLALAKVQELTALTGGRWGHLRVQMDTAYKAIVAALGQSPPEAPALDGAATTRGAARRDEPLPIDDSEKTH